MLVKIKFQYSDFTHPLLIGALGKPLSTGPTKFSNWSFCKIKIITKFSIYIFVADLVAQIFLKSYVDCNNK